MTIQTLPSAAENKRKIQAVETQPFYFNPSHSKKTVSLMTPLGLIEGDILRYVETRALTVIQDLIHDLEWPAHMILMAAGSLVRRGHVRAIQNEAVLVLEPVTDIERRVTA